MLDGGALLVTVDGQVLDVGSVPGDIDRVLDEHPRYGEDPDLPREEAQELRALLATRLPWPGILDEPTDALATIGRLRATGHEIYPAHGLELAALGAVGFQDVRVVIVGLDPYPTPGNAIGLAFSVPRTVDQLPAALRSIHTAMANDGYPPPAHGDLSGWAHQGVLLLNRALTYERGTKSGTHLMYWRDFTDQVIRVLDERADPVVFVLWGNDALKVRKLITRPHHTVITAPHPSSRGHYRTAFQKAVTFRRVNKALDDDIDWAAALA